MIQNKHESHTLHVIATGYKPDTRTVFVTHPAKKSLYSNWGLNEEVGGFSRDRYMAEDVVVASSNYIKSMERLKNYTN